jgi:hypothetical protein
MLLILPLIYGSTEKYHAFSKTSLSSGLPRIVVSVLKFPTEGRPKGLEARTISVEFIVALLMIIQIIQRYFIPGTLSLVPDQGYRFRVVEYRI